MKKLLLYISTLTLLFATGAIIGTAMAAAPIAELKEEASKASRTAVAQDMYLDMYIEVNEGPSEAAIKVVADKFKMSKEDVFKVVREGDMAPLISKQEGESLEQLKSKFTRMYAEYQNALNTENLRSDLKKKSNPSEIFTDGDTSNSEFDLLYDLTIIELIIYNEASVSEFGGQFEMPDFDFGDKGLEDLEDIFGEEAQVGKDVLDDLAEKEDQDFSSIECLDDDSNLQGALDAFNDGQEDADRDQEGEGAGDKGFELDKSGFPKAPTDEWLREYLCPEGAFFCIEVTFDSANSAVHGKTENCIMCHVTNMNKEMDKMLSKPLSPNKMSGNIFEVNKCKSSFSNVGANMHIITVEVPPPKQPKTDAYKELNIEKDFSKFKQLFKPLFFDTGDKPDPNKNASIADRTTNKAISNSGQNPGYEEISNKTADQIQKKITTANKRLAKVQNATQANTQNKDFQLIIDELDGWLTYFTSIDGLFDQMLATCNEFSQTSYCT